MTRSPVVLTLAVAFGVFLGAFMSVLWLDRAPTARPSSECVPIDAAYNSREPDTYP